MPVNRDGLVDKEKLEESISEKTAVVSIMLANNEIGTIQPIQELSENCTGKDQRISSFIPMLSRRLVRYALTVMNWE